MAILSILSINNHIITIEYKRVFVYSVSYYLYHLGVEKS